MIVNWLINRAKRTPYFHLPGYMNRWWLVPYNQVIERRTSKPFFFMGQEGIEDDIHTDGTGPVSWRRPIARLLQKLKIAVRVHEILRSDAGRASHDHPWNYLTVILRGGYIEHRYDDAGRLTSIEWHGAGSILYRPANSWHRLVVPDGMTCTTLFITGKKAQTWGFNVDGKKVPYYDYKDAAA